MSVQSVERAFSILKALAVGPAGVSELAELVSLPKSTVARLLATLESVGAVGRLDESTDYTLGGGLAELTGATDATAAIVQGVQPILARLAEELGEAAGLSVPEGYSVRYLIQVESPHPVQVRDYSGSSNPMHVGPAGLCMMSHWPPEEVRRYLSRQLEAYTARTEVDPARIVRRLEEIRRRGWMWVDEEFAEGISSVAAPVFDSLGVIAGAITVHGPTYRFPGSLTKEAVAAVVKRAADRFSVRVRTPDAIPSRSPPERADPSARPSRRPS
jgi:DNA-binding IclR family transcriptional regulator